MCTAAYGLAELQGYWSSVHNGIVGAHRARTKEAEARRVAVSYGWVRRYARNVRRNAGALARGGDRPALHRRLAGGTDRTPL